MALAGQPPLQGDRSHVRGVGAEQPLAADGRSLRAGQRTEQVGAAEKHVVLLSGRNVICVYINKYQMCSK